MRYSVVYLSRTKKKPVRTCIEEETSGMAVDTVIDEIEDCGEIVGVTLTDQKK